MSPTWQVGVGRGVKTLSERVYAAISIRFFIELTKLIKDAIQNSTHADSVCILRREGG